MSDNLAVTPGTGASIATDDVGGVQYQRVKVSWGVDGVAVDASATNPLPVVFAGALAAGNNNIGDVDIASAIPAGNNNIGDVDVASHPAGSIAGATSLPAGTNNIGDVDVLTLPALPTGTNNIGDVDVLTLPALPSGTNNIGDVDVVTLPALAAGTNNIGDVDIATIAAAADPHALTTWISTITADNAAAAVTVAADGDAMKSHYVTSIAGSFNAAATKLLVLKQGASTIGNYYVTNSFSLVFPKPLKLAANNGVTLSLAASGSSGVLGAVTLTGYTL